MGSWQLNVASVAHSSDSTSAINLTREGLSAVKPVDLITSTLLITKVLIDVSFHRLYKTLQETRGGL